MLNGQEKDAHHLHSIVVPAYLPSSPEAGFVVVFAETSLSRHRSLFAHETAVSVFCLFVSFFLPLCMSHFAVCLCVFCVCVFCFFVFLFLLLFFFLSLVFFFFFFFFFGGGWG